MNKDDIKKRIDAIEVTQEDALRLGFMDEAHFKRVSQAVMDVILACQKPDGTMLFATLLCAIDTQLAVLGKVGMDMCTTDEAKEAFRVSFIRQCMAIVAKAVGGDLVSFTKSATGGDEVEADSGEVVSEPVKKVIH